MKPIVRRWLREPLVHLVVLGSVLFVAQRWLAPPAVPRKIVLSDAVLQGLRQEYVRRNGSAPTPDAEAALVQRFIDDEVLYREALALGLDRGDIIVRRRLVQKMEFLTEDQEALPEPTEAELQAYAAAHPERYAVPERVALRHVFVSADRHGTAAESIAADLHAQLAAGVDPASLGDPFLRGQELPLHSERELAAIFGPAFAASVMALPVGSWSAPLRSSYGWHLVRVVEHSQAQPAAVGAAVRRDWQEDQRAQIRRAALTKLRGRYDIQVEGPSAMAAFASEAPLPSAGAARNDGPSVNVEW
jgi:hypothetical protein